MAVEVLSPVTMIEKEELHICELPHSIPDCTPSSSTHTAELAVDQTKNRKELPFEFLPDLSC